MKLLREPHWGCVSWARHDGHVAFSVVTHFSIHLLQYKWPHGRRRTCRRVRNASQQMTHWSSSGRRTRLENTCFGHSVLSSAVHSTCGTGCTWSCCNDHCKNESSACISSSNVLYTTSPLYITMSMWMSGTMDILSRRLCWPFVLVK